MREAGWLQRVVGTSRESLGKAKKGPHKQKGTKMKERVWNNIYILYRQSLKVKIILIHVLTRMPWFIMWARWLNGDIHTQG